jgi:type VI secretion system secreted protein Hcp
MAQDIFLKLNGIDGESPDATHKNEIEVLSWNWGVTQGSNMHAGSGGGAGKATVHDLVFEHFVDCASPNLIKYCLIGKPIAEAKLTVRKAGGNTAGISDDYNVRSDCQPRESCGR